MTDAILYIASSGCQWRMLPKDFPPVSTVQGYFYAWRDSGLWQGINDLLVMSARELEGREASPSAGVIDSQSVKTTESGGVSRLRRGQEDQGAEAAHHDRYAGPAAVCRHPLPGSSIAMAHRTSSGAIRHRFPGLREVLADGGYEGGKLKSALRGNGDGKVEIIKRWDTGKGFEVAGKWMR